MAPNLVFFLLLAPIALFTTYWAPNCSPAITDGTQKKIKKFARVHMAARAPFIRLYLRFTLFYSIITWQVMNPAHDGTTRSRGRFHQLHTGPTHVSTHLVRVYHTECKVVSLQSDLLFFSFSVCAVIFFFRF